jgi:biotin transport system substrate-specific component
MSQSVALPRSRPLVLADLIPGALSPNALRQGALASGALVRDVALVVGGAGLVGALAQLAVHVPGTPVPVTGQTLGVLVIGAAYGARRAAAAIALYAVAGVLGVPWFAGHQSGYAGASFGYVVGFLLAATLCGFLAERGADRSVWRAVPAMLAGEVLIYGVGMAWLAVAAHLSLSETIAEGLTPFLLGDAVKAALAAGLLPAAWALTGRRSGPPA